MGGIVDYSSNHPDPIALSLAEAEYNKGCSHLRMLLGELEGIMEEQMDATNIYFGSKSAMAMGNSFKDTKHMRHILRR
jgi:hypothetical protein